MLDGPVLPEELVKLLSLQQGRYERYVERYLV